MVRRVATWKWGIVAVLVAISAWARVVDADTTTSESLYSLYPDCNEDGERDRIGDGICDGVTNNNEDCGYDGGDCCECDCVINEDYETTSCLSFECEDPASSCYVEPVPTPAPAPVVPEEEEVDAEAEEDSAALLSRPVALSAATAAVCGLAASLGW